MMHSTQDLHDALHEDVDRHQVPDPHQLLRSVESALIEERRGRRRRIVTLAVAAAVIATTAAVVLPRILDTQPVEPALPDPGTHQLPEYTLGLQLQQVAHVPGDGDLHTVAVSSDLDAASAVLVLTCPDAGQHGGASLVSINGAEPQVCFSAPNPVTDPPSSALGESFTAEVTRVRSGTDQAGSTGADAQIGLYLPQPWDGYPFEQSEPPMGMFLPEWETPVDGEPAPRPGWVWMHERTLTAQDLTSGGDSVTIAMADRPDGILRPVDAYLQVTTDGVGRLRVLVNGEPSEFAVPWVAEPEWMSTWTDDPGAWTIPLPTGAELTLQREGYDQGFRAEVWWMVPEESYPGDN